MAPEKRWLRPGRRTAIAAGLAMVAVLAAAFAFREELIAWWVGYRFFWMPRESNRAGGTL